ncbi:hypothetical protein EB796_005438 [Bugula neritina]|uniref:Uncharacterized protein n=1 Tax=Bugula neritina TaxID=10212 RepID=A0A7J7KEB3_BUGNE|nr:hypothetical protein EB796_005438 [Bugula neritina]
MLTISITIGHLSSNKTAITTSLSIAVCIYEITNSQHSMTLTLLDFSLRQFDASGSPPRHAVIRGSEQNLVRSGRGQK